MPFLSIIIPLYNKELYIGKTIQSVLNQSFDDFEIVVVNDGSKDNSLKIVSNITDNRIRIINQENSGVSAARNRGMAEACGKYYFFLDADDVLMDNAFDLCYKIKNKELVADIFAGSFIEKNINGEIVKNKTNATEGILKDAYKELFKKKLFLRIGSMFINRSIIERTEPMRLDISLYEDMEWIYRLIYATTIYSSQQIILEYTRYESGLSSIRHDISKNFAGIATLKGIKPKYRKRILGDFIFRCFLLRLKQKDWKGVKTILKLNKYRIIYAAFCFIYKIIITRSFKR